MLAQNFKSHTDLRITEPELSALQKTLVLLETGKLAHIPFNLLSSEVEREPTFSGYFNMRHITFEHTCGTVGCIKGTAEMISGIKFGYRRNDSLHELFCTETMNDHDITPEQAATALRSYLTTGDARWDLAVA